MNRIREDLVIAIFIFTLLVIHQLSWAKDLADNSQVSVVPVFKGWLQRIWRLAFYRGSREKNEG